jgi:hypothetical protein
VEPDPSARCELLVGLPAVVVVGVDEVPGDVLRVTVETRDPGPSCAPCAGSVAIKDQLTLELVDLPCFGRSTRLAWRNGGSRV